MSRYIVAETYGSKVLERLDTYDAALACAKKEACGGKCVSIYEQCADVVPAADVRVRLTNGGTR